MRILVVEDSSTMRRVIVQVARELGLEAIEAPNGAEAMILLRKHAHDIALVVLDWNMPVMDGYQALTKIRSTPEYNQIPVLMATSDGVAEDVQKAIAAGANGYLVKPFKKEELSARISQMIPAAYLQQKS